MEIDQVIIILLEMLVQNVLASYSHIISYNVILPYPLNSTVLSLGKRLFDFGHVYSSGQNVAVYKELNFRDLGLCSWLRNLAYTGVSTVVYLQVWKPCLR